MDLTARPVSNYRAILSEIRLCLSAHRESFYDVSCCDMKLSKRLKNLSSQLMAVIDTIPYYDLLSSHLDHKFPPRKEIIRICSYLDTIACQMSKKRRDTILIYDLNLEISRFFKENSLTGEVSLL